MVDLGSELLAKLKAWCGAMHETAPRRIVLNNLIHDCQRGRLPKDVVNNLLRAIADAWAAAPEGIVPERLIERIADSDPAAYLCRGHSDALTVMPCSRIVDAYSWSKNVLSTLPGGGILSDEVSDRVLKHFEQEFPVKLIRADRKMTQGNRPFAWVTQTEAIEGLISRLPREEKSRGRAALATMARDCLGLRHYNDDQKMIEIRYPVDALKDMQLAPPTFVEGSPGVIYRSQQGSDGWGRTVNLTTGDPGLPEAVHRPLEFSDSFRIYYLGSIQGRTERFTWDELEQLCPARLPPGELVDYLYDLAKEAA